MDRAISTRDRIELAAGALFRERGYAATSVRDIARALDIQGASLYAHIASKEDVLWSLVERAAQRFEAAADAATGRAPSRASRDRLRALVRAHVLVVTDDPHLASVFVREWRQLSAERRELILERRDRYEDRFRTLIADGIAGGDFGPVDPATASLFLLTALNGVVDWYRPNGRLPATRIADAFADLAVRSLTGAPA
jgi:TetR/AcrR family transcriptional regulator, cholesterol catabolism regulator